MTYHIACIGEPLAEISQTAVGHGVAFGGDALNTAIYCVRGVKDHDIAVHYVSAVGHDALSQAVLDLMATEGLRTEHVSRDPQRQIGIYAIQNDDKGERSFHYWRDTSAAREMFATDASPHFEAIKEADLVYLSGITLAVITQEARDRLWAVLAAQRLTGLRVAFDSNYRPKLWETSAIARREITRFWQISDIALPSQEDETALFGNSEPTVIIDRILAAGAQSGALKCGDAGPIQIPQTSTPLRYILEDAVVDTTGAGDSFNGAYLAAISCGKLPTEALFEAHNLARRVIGHQGAILPKSLVVRPKRMGSVIHLKPEHCNEYKRLHAGVWPGVLQRLGASNIGNYSIYLKMPECLMFSYFEYTGTDFAADDAAISADPITKEWWALCGPMQTPFENRAGGEWWAKMEEVFHVD